MVPLKPDVQLLFAKLMNFEHVREWEEFLEFLSFNPERSQFDGLAKTECTENSRRFKQKVSIFKFVADENNFPLLSSLQN